MVKQQKYTMNLSGPPLFQIFSPGNISDVSPQNRKIQMASRFIQAYWSIKTSHVGAASADSPQRSQYKSRDFNIPELPEATTFTQDYLIE
jgi:hypothetical protein